MTDVGIIIPAIGIDDLVVRRLKKSIQNAEFSGSLETIVIHHAKTDLPNVSRARNEGIRSLSHCDVVICADADVVVSKGLITASYDIAQKGKHCWQYPTDIYDGPPFERKSGKGPWNAMTYQNWVRVGGWDERCFGWGGEDDVLHRDISLAGIQSCNSGVPLFHHRHESRCAKRGQENLLVAQLTPWNWIKPNAHMCLHVTSKCNLECRDCSMSPLMRASPGYELSVSEVEKWIDVTLEARYHFNSVVLTGGEPTLCSHLPKIASLIKQSGICDHVKMFTNCAGLERMQDKLLPSLDLVAVSDHGQLIPDLRAWGNRAWVTDRREHFPRPDNSIENTLPAKCVGGLEFCLYSGRVYECPTALSTAIHYKWAIDSEVVKGRYLDRLMSLERYNQKLCRVCTANRRVRAITGSRPVKEIICG